MSISVSIGNFVKFGPFGIFLKLIIQYSLFYAIDKKNNLYIGASLFRY